MKPSFDPVTLQVMTNAIHSVAEEMVATLVRTSFSTNVKDRRDCSGAVFSAKCDLVGQSEVGTPLHLGVMLPTVKTALKAIPPESLRPGDHIIVNSPYPEGPGHLNDIAIVSPIFLEDEIVGFAANMSHHVDVGGFAPGSMPFGVWEHFQEGLRIPPILLARQGVIDEGVLALIEANVRTGVELRGDLGAQVAANNVGQERLQSLCCKYGKDVVQFYMDEIVAYSERRLRASIRELPDGEYSAEDRIHGDGLSLEPTTIRLKLTVDGDTIRADFRASDDQVRGPINCRPPSVRACVYYAAKALLDPELPISSGAFRPLEVLTRPGSLLEVEFPGAVCNANIITTQRIVDVLLNAMRTLKPERAAAASSGTMNLINMGGRDPSTGDLFNYIETYGGGHGAMRERDGTSAVQSHMTNTRNAPVEVIESTYPVEIESYGIVEETAGPGWRRGGYGMQRTFRLLAEEATVTLSSDRFEEGPWGIEGGGDGSRGLCHVLRGGRGEAEVLPSKATFRLSKGDVFRSQTPGGGGWGDPYERDPELVRIDVLDGLLSRPAAEELYGVVLDAANALNQKATEERRASARAR